jgi:hypothetical protein
MDSDGEVKRANTNDTLANEVDFLTVNNETGGVLVKCTPVYQTATADQVDKAQGNAIATARVLGLLVEDIADEFSGSLLTDGRLVATTTEWDAVTDQVGGLTPGAKYYLSAATAGKLSTSLPADVEGNVVAPVGLAKSTTVMEVSIGTRIVL